VLAYLNKQAQIRSQLRTRSKNTFFIWAQLASYLAFLLIISFTFLSHPFYLIEGEIEGEEASNCAEIDACLFK
jgi:hypothetical protein